ncbi:MAG: sigma-54 dependent transcriptional regulator [candidate division Zixibacteria bacterium]|nr:sigma-54 dependent transcriptional regulator [candidate division Zixibacteria bacterium]
MKEKVKLLVIDDDPTVSWLLSEGLGEGYEILTARDGNEGIKFFSQSRPDLILLDIKMPGLNGIQVLEQIKEMDRLSEVIMLSGHGETKNVVESIRLGASEFINKPFDVKEVEIHIQKVLEKNKLKKELDLLKSELQAKSQYDKLIGESPKMLQVKSLIEQVADSDLAILIRGESGTGKEIVARMIHSLSSRKNEYFAKQDCAAIPRDLLESEMFGYEKGAFTGAHKTKPGRFETAHKGTMFLDEIGEMPLDLQSKLLQVLEQHEFLRVGGIKNIQVDVRIVSATNRDLEKALENGLFRDDLYYRLNEVTINLPALREMREDIPFLVDHFLKKCNLNYKRNYAQLSPKSMKLLQEYGWPGNVRQLENLIKQIVVRADENIIAETIKATVVTSETMEEFGAPAGEKDYSLKKRVARSTANQEKKLILEVLNKTNWNRRKASELLEISYRSLLYKIKEYRINETGE